MPSNPRSGATGLGTNTIVEAQFSGPVDPNAVAGITLSSGGSTVATSISMSAGNSIAQLVPAVPLSPGTTYTMTISGVKDPAGNAVATATNTFTTGATFDINGPTATLSDPVNGTTAGTNAIPKLVFNKPLNPLTVNNNTFRMYLTDTNQWIPLTVTESTSGLEVTMTPQIPLLPNSQYHFQACCGYQDQDGNDGNEADEYFTTTSGTVTTGPTVTVSPVNAATGIPLNSKVYVTVSAPIDETTFTQNSVQLLLSGSPVAGTASITNAQMLVFTPTSALTASTAYTVKVSGFADANGNTVVTSTTTFTTGTTTATGGLTLTSANITSGGSVSNNLQPIILTFSQPIDPLTVNTRHAAGDGQLECERRPG